MSVDIGRLVLDRRTMFSVLGGVTGSLALTGCFGGGGDEGGDASQDAGEERQTLPDPTYDLPAVAFFDAGVGFVDNSMLETRGSAGVSAEFEGLSVRWSYGAPAECERSPKEGYLRAYADSGEAFCYLTQDANWFGELMEPVAVEADSNETSTEGMGNETKAEDGGGETKEALGGSAVLFHATSGESSSDEGSGTQEKTGDAEKKDDSVAAENATTAPAEENVVTYDDREMQNVMVDAVVAAIHETLDDASDATYDGVVGSDLGSWVIEDGGLDKVTRIWANTGVSRDHYSVSAGSESERFDIPFGICVVHKGSSMLCAVVVDASPDHSLSDEEAEKWVTELAYSFGKREAASQGSDDGSRGRDSSGRGSSDDGGRGMSDEGGRGSTDGGNATASDGNESFGRGTSDGSGSRGSDDSSLGRGTSGDSGSSSRGSSSSSSGRGSSSDGEIGRGRGGSSSSGDSLVDDVSFDDGGSSRG